MPNHIVAPVQVAEVSRLNLTAESARGTQPSAPGVYSVPNCFEAEASNYVNPATCFGEE